MQDDEPESRPETSGSRKGNSAGSTRPITGYGRKSSAVPIPEPDQEPDDNQLELGGNGNHSFGADLLIEGLRHTE